MRLFHVSEDPDIRVFHPRLPTRRDLDPTVGLVWTIDEQRLPNFLTPRNCPRVAYHAGADTSADDRQRFFASGSVSHAVVIEHGWLDPLRRTTLYVYEFSPEDFSLQDAVAGYYVAKTTQIPIAKHTITDLPGELAARGVEIRVTDNLWDIADAVQASTLNWSLCRMAYAAPRR
ncbi:MAG: hypothetical protein E7463_04280 [Ruminococcaceae bacterium]|nr:hypothetical protein [Oscillospiraceae bacterium]